MYVPYNFFRAFRCLKGLIFGSSILTFVSLVLVFKNVEFNYNGHQENWISNDKIDFFTKFQVMPGGDDVPASPPWTYAPAYIHSDLDDFDRNETLFVTSKFFMSPGQGNLMFQYASLFAIAKRNNATLIVPEGLLLRRSFNISSSIASNRLVMYFLKNWIRKFYYDCCRYYPIAMELTNGTKHALYGYFQSYKYFHDYRDAILNEFQFLPKIKETATDIIKASLDSKNKTVLDTILVGLHVRRGLDLTWNLRNQQHGHTIATKDYFINAMTYFREKYLNVLFLVCSDDLYWCRQNLIFDDVVIMNSSQKTREVDLAILRSCNHTIMSTGTFSWWAAYLAKGEAVYYSNWPRPGSKLDSMVNKTDFFLPEWKPML